MISFTRWIEREKSVRKLKKFELNEKEFDEINEKLKNQLEIVKDLKSLNILTSDDDLGLGLGLSNDCHDIDNDGCDDNDIDNDGDDNEDENQDEDMEQDNENDQETSPEDRYALDTYDDEPSNSTLFSNVKGLSYYSSNSQDPYITLNSESDSDDEILPTDNLLLAAKTEDEVSYLEVYVYERDEDNLYVHHDIMLPSFPLCLEWLDFVPKDKAKDIQDLDPNSTRGNFVAIGTFDPQVEIWDLDLLDAPFPTVVLGEIPTKTLTNIKKKYGPARVSKKIQKERHVDAVMGMSWNGNKRNLLATASADTTVKLWDLNSSSEAIMSYSNHSDKVQVRVRVKIQAVEWNKTEITVLLSGGYDQQVFAFDSRQASKSQVMKLSADVECLRWTKTPTNFLVGCEDGIVYHYDIRKPNSPIWSLSVGDGAVSSLDVNPSLDCMVTGSANGFTKVWDLTNNPVCIIEKDLGVGKVFSTEFCGDGPGLVSVGGSNGKVVVWNLERNSNFKKVYKRKGTEGAEVVGVVEEDVENESDDDEDDAQEMEE